MIEFIGKFSDLKTIGYKFEKYTSSRCNTWVKYKENPYRDVIRVWQIGGHLDVDHLSGMSRLFCNTILDDELFNSFKTINRDGEIEHCFMINRKTFKVEPYIYEKHDSIYVMDSIIREQPSKERCEELTRICLGETRDCEIFKLRLNSWLVEHLRELRTMGFIKYTKSGVKVDE